MLAGRATGVDCWVDCWQPMLLVRVVKSLTLVTCGRTIWYLAMKSACECEECNGEEARTKFVATVADLHSWTSCTEWFLYRSSRTQVAQTTLKIFGKLNFLRQSLCRTSDFEPI
jgi:hypothetical protein